MFNYLGVTLGKRKQIKLVGDAVTFPSEITVDVPFRLKSIGPKVASTETPLPHKTVDTETTFPIFHRTKQIDSSFQDSPTVTHKVHLKDGGSCVVPRGHTITLHEWRKQNGYA